MKKFFSFRRLLAALLCCLMILPGATVNATNNNPIPTINDKAKGSLTLYKYDNEDKVKPVKGAQFIAYRVAKISSAGVESLISGYDFTASTVVNSALITAVTSKTDLVKYLATETNGVYTFSEMELGIYLVVETVIPTNYYAATDAFLASIPQTNEAGDAWEYDVVAYPKNKLITVEKSVTEAGETADSYDIGDKVPFIVTSTIPRYSNNTYTMENNQINGIAASATVNFYITDTMSAGLDFNNDVVIKAGTNAILEAGTDKDYTVSFDKVTRVLTITLTRKAIATYAGMPITVTYSATLNENAKVYDGEKNSVTVTFTTKPQTGNNHTTLPKETNVYTYQMDMKKTFEGTPTNIDYSKVQFTLAKGEKLLYAKLVEGTWIVNTSITQAVDGYTTNLHLNTNGKLIIKGLSDGSYILTETSTINGYNLLKAPITIVVSEVENSNGQVTGAVNAEIEGKEVEEVNGSFSFTVLNTKGFELPKTGGMGTWMYTIGGLFLMAATAALMFTLKRRNAVK